VLCEYAEHVSTRCWRTIDQRVEEITRQAPHRAGRERGQGRGVAATVDDSDLVQGTRRGKVAEANGPPRKGRDGSGYATLQEQQEVRRRVARVAQYLSRDIAVGSRPRPNLP